MMHPLQFTAMYKNLCALENNTLVSQFTTEVTFVNTDKGILQEELVTVADMAHRHKQILQKNFQAEFPTSEKEVRYCGADVIFDLLRNYPELVVGIEDKVVKLAADVAKESWFDGTRTEATVIKLFAGNQSLMNYVIETVGTEFEESFRQWLLRDEKVI